MTTQNTINSHPDDIIWTPTATLYIYNADLYCKPCGMAKIEQINEALDKDVHGTLDWSNNPDLYEDSNSWPQEYSRGDGESDSPDHCGKCSRFLGRNLTDDGIAYVQESAREELDRDGAIGEIVQGWMDFYGIELEN
jgi:hypothetical protein